MQVEEKQKSIILQSASRFPPPQGVRFSYGTAGFRSDASILSATVFRVGILAALRSLKTRSVTGLMITASHNQVSDNGIKIADPHGGMMTQDWEPFADAIVNAGNPEDLLLLIIQFAKKENISFGGAQPAEILLGRDTRPSGGALLEAAKQGINAVIGAVAIDVGILTTPQLHWMVRCRNKGLEALERDYFAQLSSSFGCLMDLVPRDIITDTVDEKLIVDGANGVGGEKLEELKKQVKGLVIQVRNSGKEGEGILNEGVGADYVQKEKVVPCGFGPNDVGIRCASLDGDADRLVYFRVLSTSSNSIDLVDGDKILSLFALFIKEQLSILNKNEKEESSNNNPVRLGIVQTAYANGASTDYLRQLGLEVVFTPTGVKYLHEKAAEYDVGIYFEANGHGTILFSEQLLCWLEARKNELASASAGCECQKSAFRLLAVSRLINQAVGDALSGLFLVEAILQHMGWSIEKWSELYKDLPSKQLKVKVMDRTAVITTNAETVVVVPSGLQEVINTETGAQAHLIIRDTNGLDFNRNYTETIMSPMGPTNWRKIAALCEEREDSDTKLEMDSQRSDAKEDDDKDSSSDLSLPKPEHFPKIEDFVSENGESDSKSETGDYCGEKCGSDPITDGDLSTTVDDCLTEECDLDLSSHQNPTSEDASAAIDELESPLPEEYYHNQGSSKDASALSDDLMPVNSSTTENHKLQECQESGTDSVADADFGHEQLKLKPSDQVMLEHEESRDLEELKSSNQVPPECEESMTDDPNADGDLGLDIDLAEKLKSECKKTDPDSDAGEVDLEISSAAAIHIPKEDGESGGNSIADSSSSVEDLNKENENFDCQDHLVENSVLRLEFTHLSSSMKKLALDYPQDLLVEKIAKSTEFSSSEALNFPDADFLGETPAGNQFLVGSPASLRRKKISAPNPGSPLGSRSCGPSNKKGTAAKTPTRSNIFEDVDKENKGRESVKREMKVLTINVGENKEQNALDDMSMRAQEAVQENKRRDGEEICTPGGGQ